MLVACVLIDHFPFRMEARRDPFLAHEDVIIIQEVQRKRLVLDTSPTITDIPAGTPLQQALSRHPVALQREADVALYRRQFDEVLTQLEQVSPIVQEAHRGCAYLGLDGLEDMYGGRAGLLTALERAVPPDLGPRFGVGPGMFPAYAAALSAKPGHCVIAPADLQGFLGDFPLEVLPLSWEQRTSLRRLGLTHVKDIARQRVGSMQASLGADGRRIWELARGADRRPLTPRRQELECSATMAFPSATVAHDTLLLALQALAAQLFARPDLRGRFVRSALVSGTIVRRPAWERRVAFKEPVGDPGRALPAFKNLLSLRPPPGPVEDLTLTLTGMTGEAARQGSLLPDVRRLDQLKEALRQLEVILGKRPPIYQLKDVQPWSRIPEERRILLPPTFP
ncbi:MAG: DNA polymerase Y family protein [Chloroflexi bacterium]|nr:DNA polymerase Y family protein [Chloroflexota bacterium]